MEKTPQMKFYVNTFKEKLDLSSQKWRNVLTNDKSFLYFILIPFFLPNDTLALELSGNLMTKKVSSIGRC